MKIPIKTTARSFLLVDKPETSSKGPGCRYEDINRTRIARACVKIISKVSGARIILASSSGSKSKLGANYREAPPLLDKLKRS
jgi:hypothetical protein